MCTICLMVKLLLELGRGDDHDIAGREGGVGEYLDGRGKGGGVAGKGYTNKKQRRDSGGREMVSLVGILIRWGGGKQKGPAVAATGCRQHAESLSADPYLPGRGRTKEEWLLPFSSYLCFGRTFLHGMRGSGFILSHGISVE